MKKIITAIGDENINRELKREKNIEIVLNDIQYKEGILEVLEEYQEIDYIIISIMLQGEITIEELIKQINIKNKNIKIIIILENNNSKKTEELINNKLIYKIIYKDKNNLINLKKIIEIINDNKNDTENDRENNTQNNVINNDENIIINKKNINKKINNNFNKNKVICITGPPGVGKTIISINLAKINIYKKNKILIIDFDFLNNSVSLILGLENSVNPNKIIDKNVNNYIINENINNKFTEYFNIIKINKKIDLLRNKPKISYNNNIMLNEIINNIYYLKEKYEIILIDTNCNEELKIIEQIVKISDKCLFISDTNLLEINKSLKLLDKFINKFYININKINLIFNKYNSESIDFNLLKNIFSEFNIIGKLNYNKNYNKLINKNNKYNLINKKLRDEYLKINNKILI